MVVTAAEGNMIKVLASKRRSRSDRGDREVGPRERALAATGLLIGIVIDENRPEYERGDFLIRGLLGADRSSGALLASGTRCGWGRTVRFHVRDARSADEDLRQALALQNEALAGRTTAGALLFTCNGRGSHMFPGRRPRRRGPRRVSRRAARLGVLLCGRDRAGRRQELPARLHRDDRPSSRPISPDPDLLVLLPHRH